MAIDSSSYYYRSTTDIMIGNMTLLEKLNMIYDILPYACLSTSDVIYVLTGMGIDDLNRFRTPETETQTVRTYFFSNDKLGIELEICDDTTVFRTNTKIVILRLSQNNFSFNGYYTVNYIETKEDHFNETMMNPDITDWEIYEMVQKIKNALPT
ncbi:hypothetical protein XaC1_534 [Xanthomonas phage XaC1]|nr:hypothetical protein XaC1_534 [Xanthomonas phage XaC1]